MPSVKKPKRQRNHTFIKAWREHNNLTQDRAAERIGISRENYGRIENGKVPYNQDFLEVCAVAFNCSASDLLENDPGIDRMIDKLKALLDKASPGDQARIFRVVKSLLENN